MTHAMFSANQRQAMEYLGYKRWLVRQDLADWHQSQTTDNYADAQTHFRDTLRLSRKGSRENLTESLQPSIVGNLAKQTVNEPDDVQNNDLGTESSYDLVQGQNEGSARTTIDSFQLNDLTVSLTKQMTLLAWQSTMTSHAMLMALPPLWGASDALALFATEREGELFTKALRVCELGEIADKLKQAEDFICSQKSSIVLADALANNPRSVAKTIIIIVNEDLPSLCQLKESVANDSDVEVVALLHPFDCLQNPLKKAKLWQQLMNLQVKL